MIENLEYNFSFETQDELFDSFREFEEYYIGNPTIIEKLDNCLSTLTKKHTYPFTVFQSINDTIPLIIGQNGTRFLVHLLRNGVPKELENIDRNLLVDLKILVQKYGIPFICAERVINNPLDYGTLQLMSSSDSDKNFLRIIRADQSCFELNLDLQTMSLFVEHLLDKIHQVIDTKDETIPLDSLNHLVSKVFELLVASGVLNENEFKG